MQFTPTRKGENSPGPERKVSKLKYGLIPEVCYQPAHSCLYPVLPVIFLVPSSFAESNRDRTDNLNTHSYLFRAVR